MSKTDYGQLTEKFRRNWNLIAGANKALGEDIQHLLGQMVETGDKSERAKLKTEIETLMDHIKDNRTAQVALQRDYSFVCGKHFSKMWLPDRDVAVSFDPSTQDFRIE